MKLSALGNGWKHLAGIVAAAVFTAIVPTTSISAQTQMQNFVSATYSFDRSMAAVGLRFGIDPSNPIFTADGTVTDTDFSWTTSGLYLGQSLSWSMAGAYDSISDSFNWTGVGAYGATSLAMEGTTIWSSPTDFGIKDSISFDGTIGMISGWGASPDYNYGTSTVVAGSRLIKMVDETRYFWIQWKEWTSGWQLEVTQPDGTIQTNVYTLTEEQSGGGVSLTSPVPAGFIQIGGQSFQKLGGVSGIPEPETWTMMLVGFGGLGICLRSRRKVAISAT